MKTITTSNIIIIDKYKKILLIKRAKGPDAGDLWSLPGGACQEGETKEETLIREIKEELGCSLASFNFFRTFKTPGNEKLIIANYFWGTIEGPIILDKNESSEYRWFNKMEPLPSLAFNQNLVLSEFQKINSQ